MVEAAINKHRSIAHRAALETVIQPAHSRWRHLAGWQVCLHTPDIRMFDSQLQVYRGSSFPNRKIDAEFCVQGDILIADCQRISPGLYTLVPDQPMDIALQLLKRQRLPKQLAVVNARVMAVKRDCAGSQVAANASVQTGK